MAGTTANGPLGSDQVDRALVSELAGALHGWDGNLFAGANIKPSERDGDGAFTAAFPPEGRHAVVQEGLSTLRGGA